jgi:arylsulfatase
LLLASALALWVAKAPSRPNIVLIVVDTLRADRIDRTIDGQPLMPNVARLAARSVRFDAATAPAPMTMPSMAALLTGLYPDRSGVVTHSRATALASASPTLAEAARSAGYATAAVVANPWLASATTGFVRGFDSYVSKRSLGVRGSRLEAPVLTDAAIALLRGAKQPLLLWAHYIDTHMPYQPPPADAARLGQPHASSAVIRDYIEGTQDRQTIYFSPPYPDAELEATRALYDAAARSVDREIGRLIAAVEAVLDRENTVVVFTADHGEALGEHGLWFAHDFTLYRELTHVPLLFLVPGRAAARISSPVSLVDVTPTLCRLAALACRRDLDGTVLALEDTRAAHRAVFSVGPPFRERYERNPFIRAPGLEGRWSSLRERGTALLRIPTGSGIRWERYDTASDPGESRNVFDAERDADGVRRLEQWLNEQAAARPKATTPARPLAWPPSDVRDLRALGYLD